MGGGLTAHPRFTVGGDAKTRGKAAIAHDLSGIHAHLYRAGWDANGVVTA